MFSTRNTNRRDDDCCEPFGVVSMPRQMSSQPTHVENQPNAADRAEMVAWGQRRDKNRALKRAMMQELLTGRTRLV
jgi:hypothetical protein